MSYKNISRKRNKSSKRSKKTRRVPVATTGAFSRRKPATVRKRRGKKRLTRHKKKVIRAGSVEYDEALKTFNEAQETFNESPQSEEDNTEMCTAQNAYLLALKKEINDKTDILNRKRTERSYNSIFYLIKNKRNALKTTFEDLKKNSTIPNCVYDPDLNTEFVQDEEGDYPEEEGDYSDKPGDNLVEDPANQILINKGELFNDSFSKGYYPNNGALGNSKSSEETSNFNKASSNFFKSSEEFKKNRATKHLPSSEVKNTTSSDSKSSGLEKRYSTFAKNPFAYLNSSKYRNEALYPNSSKYRNEALYPNQYQGV